MLADATVRLRVAMLFICIVYVILFVVIGGVVVFCLFVIGVCVGIASSLQLSASRVKVRVVTFERGEGIREFCQGMLLPRKDLH